MHTVYFEISLFPPVIFLIAAGDPLCEFPRAVFLHSKTIHNQTVLTVVFFSLPFFKIRFQVK